MKGSGFQSFLGGARAAWPLAPRAQQRGRMRRVGVLHFSEQDPESKAYIATFLQQLGELGWTVGNNLQVEYRWTGGLDGRIYQYATELVALEPDVILAAGDSHVGPLQQITHSVPIVFVQVADAVGGGFVKSLAHPGGNATGFTNFEFTSAENGWNCSSRSRHARRGWQSSGIRTSLWRQTGRYRWSWRDPLGLT